MKPWVLMALVTAGCVTGGGADPAYRVVDRITGPDGRYDYVSVDPALGRVFVGRGNGVMTVDLPSRRVTPVLAKGVGVAAVLPLPDAGLILATNGDVDTAMLVDRRSGRVTATIPTGDDPDGAAYDAGSGLVFVMNGGSEDVSIIDPSIAREVARVPAGGVPEAAIADGRGNMFVNVEDTAEVIRIDVATRRVTGRYALPGCEEPTGIAYDHTTDLLISACHNGVAKLVNARTGADRGGFAIGKMADGAIFDEARRLIYIPCNDGTLWIVALDRTGATHPVATVPTQIGARTAALDPVSGRLYLPATDYTTPAQGDPERVPGTFRLLVVAPGGSSR